MRQRKDTSDDDRELQAADEPGPEYDDLDDADQRELAWDANDERRRKDCFAPPEEPCECYCLHCGRTFMSDRIWLQRIIGDPDPCGMEGFWMCPTPNCDGKGFTFDIFPTDPDHPANEGTYYDDDDEEGEEDDWWDQDAEPDAAWDPDETKYKELDEAFGNDDGDIEGEEWKYGLAPGEHPPEPDWMEQARLEHDEEERRYDEPDERPRVIDWSDRDDRKPRAGPAGDDDDDIPF
jgi:hypothetical protein